MATLSTDDERIQPALYALLTGDADSLRTAIDADPGVVNVRVGTDTLLELTTQPDLGPPSSEIIDVLVGAGADLDRALNLAGCWNLADLCRQLLAAGADPTVRADANITPLESAAMHRSTAAADVLVEHGPAPPGPMARSSNRPAAVSAGVDRPGRDAARRPGRVPAELGGHRPSRGSSSQRQSG